MALASRTSASVYETSSKCSEAKRLLSEDGDQSSSEDEEKAASEDRQRLKCNASKHRANGSTTERKIKLMKTKERTAVLGQGGLTCLVRVMAAVGV